MACAVILLGRLGDPPLPHPLPYALAKHARNGISQYALAKLVPQKSARENEEAKANKMDRHNH